MNRDVSFRSILLLLLPLMALPLRSALPCGGQGEPEILGSSTQASLPAGLVLVAIEGEEGWGVPQQVGRPVNHEGNDCAPAITLQGDRLYFEREWGPHNRNDIFVSVWTDSGWSDPENLGPPINTDLYSESKPAVSPSGDTLFFTTRGEIHMATRNGSSWNDPVAFDAVNSSSDDSSPYLSANGREFYLTSDRPGGYGWMDVYVSTRVESGWSEPVNLGPNVNTSDIEWYCCLSPDTGTLYFVTSRPGGYGDVDLWYSRRTEEGWSLPKNLGGVVNVRGPSCKPSISGDGRTLYFGGSRPGEGEGGLDLWFTTWMERGQR